jgi:hypothetical protein
LRIRASALGEIFNRSQTSSRRKTIMAFSHCHGSPSDVVGIHNEGLFSGFKKRLEIVRAGDAC